MKIPKEKLSRFDPPKNVEVKLVDNSTTTKPKGVGSAIKQLLKPLVKGTKLENCKGCQKRADILDKVFPLNQ